MASSRKALPQNVDAISPNETSSQNLESRSQGLYQYLPLQDPDLDIRLAVLQPGQAGDAIKLHTVNSSLSDKPSYEALSYTWGDPKITVPISISNSTFRATMNLESALRHLQMWKFHEICGSMLYASTRMIFKNATIRSIECETYIGWQRL